MSEIKRLVLMKYFDELLLKNSKNNFIYSKNDVLINPNKSGQINLFEKITSEHIEKFQLDTNLVFGIGGYILFTNDIIYILREIKNPDKLMSLKLQFLTSTYEEINNIEWVPNTGKLFPNGKILFNKKNLLLVPHSIKDNTVNNIIDTIKIDISEILVKLKNNEFNLESLNSNSLILENNNSDKEVVSSSNPNKTNEEKNTENKSINIDKTLIKENVTSDYNKVIQKKYSEKNSKIDISEIISDWYLNFSLKYQLNLVTKEYILKQNKLLFSSNIWKSDVIKDSLNDSRFYGDIKFGTNSGIIFIGTRVYFIEDGSSYINFNLNELKENTFKDILKQECIKIEEGYIKKFYDIYKYNDGGMGLGRKRISTQDISLLNEIVKFINEHIKIYNKIILEKKKVEDEIKKDLEVKRIEKLNIKKNNILSELDKDGNGEIDLIDSDSFNKLISLHQKNIIDIDKSYIQKFVKISIYIKNKKSNIQSLFKKINKTKNEEELNESLNLLKNQIHTYDLLIFHSINMVTSLIESDLITFYEIYECFDQLGIFNSNWENEVMNKLNDIGNGLNELLYRIYQMEYKIVSSINNLSYVTQDSFKELNISVNNQLSSINSSIKFNNLLTGIQTYQMYKINQNIKRIN
jgi:hypothetical protein